MGARMSKGDVLANGLTGLPPIIGLVCNWGFDGPPNADEAKDDAPRFNWLELPAAAVAGGDESSKPNKSSLAFLPLGGGARPLSAEEEPLDFSRVVVADLIADLMESKSGRCLAVLDELDAVLRLSNADNLLLSSKPLLLLLLTVFVVAANVSESPKMSSMLLGIVVAENFGEPAPLSPVTLPFDDLLVLDLV